MEDVMVLDGKISSHLMSLTKEASLRLHVSLVRKDDAGNEVPVDITKSFLYNNKNYYHIELRSYMTLEIKDGDWSPDKSVMITDDTIFQFILGLEQAVEYIYMRDTFIIVDGETKINKEVLAERIVKIYNMRASKVIIEPVTIYSHHEDLIYEGVRIYLNSSTNFFELTVDKLRALLYKINKVDLFLYAHALVDVYIASVKNGKLPVRTNGSTNKSYRRNSIFNDLNDKPPTTGVSSTLKSNNKLIDI